MTIDKREMLSALVDGELTHNELDQALAYLKSDDATKQFIKYQKLSDVMRGYQAENITVDLTARLANALDLEPTYSTENNSKVTNIISFPRKLWKQASGLAIAASIGAMAVLGVMSQQHDQRLTNVEVASADSNDNTSATGQGNRWTVSEPEVADRLNNYLVEHNEYAGASGVFSYARVVSYDSE